MPDISVEPNFDFSTHCHLCNMEGLAVVADYHVVYSVKNYCRGSFGSCRNHAEMTWDIALKKGEEAEEECQRTKNS